MSNSRTGQEWVWRTSVGLGLYALVGGTISLLGWVWDRPWLADWDGDGIAIQPNATVAAIAAGLALLLINAGFHKTAGLLGLLVAFIGATTVAQMATGIDLGIDTVLMFGRSWGRVGVLYPGRMGPPGAVSWTIIGTALLWAAGRPGLRERARAIAPWLAVVTTTVATLSLVGYLYSAHVLFTIPTVTVIALQTSSFIFAVSIGLILTIRERGPMRLLLDEGPAGAMVRRIVPALVAVPVFLGLLRMAGDRAGIYDIAFGTAVRTIAEIVLLLALLWWTGSAISTETARQREQERQHRRDLEDADRRKTQFLATLAHELRNPLAPIRTAAALLKHPDLPETERARARAIIERQAAAMARLLDDLLDLSRITTDKLELRSERMELAQAIDGAVELCDPLVKEQHHTLTVALPPEPMPLDADPARLVQVFGNLINNACRYMEPRGHIWVTAAREDGSAVVRIRDSGLGIPSEKLSTIFEMFSQVDQPRERAQSGLGVGLHLVKRLVDLHHGRVEVYSRGSGTGAEFVVRLPIAADHQVARGA